SCELHGEGSASGSIAAEVHGEADADASRACELAGVLSATASRACELAGVLSATASRSAELHGEESVSASRSAEVTGELSDGAARSAELTGEMNHPRTSFANGGGGSWDTVVAVAIDHAKVPSDLTDFQLYVRLSDLGDAFWDAVQDGGADIRVTDIGGVELAREVVSCATATKTGELWVKVPSVSSSADTVINIYVGDGSAYDYAPTDTYGAQAVWGASAKYVGHFEVDADDSSAAGTTATVSGASPTSGKIGDAYNFGGVTPTSIDTNYTFATADKFELSFWVKRTAVFASNIAWCDRFNSYSNNVVIECRDTDYLRFRYGGSGTGHVLDTRLALDEWTHIVWQNDARVDLGGGNYSYTYRLYVNGVKKETTFLIADAKTVSGAFDIGKSSGASPYVDNDDVRLSTAHETDATIAAEYANQSDPGTFYAVVRDDSNRSAELHGEDGADANFAAELRGEDTASADVAAEIRGEAGADAARACELAGEVRSDASRHAELHGEGASSASIGAEVSGEAHASAGRSAELRGEDSASGSVAAELHGSLTVSASRDCELHGEDSASGSVACEVVGMTTPYPYVRRPSPYTRYAGH
ncbi:MAG: DUF2341 domain-containing protein, partial [Parcubacteria group bacterium]